MYACVSALLIYEHAICMFSLTDWLKLNGKDEQGMAFGWHFATHTQRESQSAVTSKSFRLSYKNEKTNDAV